MKDVHDKKSTKDWVTSDWGMDVATYLANKGKEASYSFIRELFWLDEEFGIKR